MADNLNTPSLPEVKPLSRRHVVAGAVTAALAVPYPDAADAMTHPDGRLLELYRAWRVNAVAYDTSDDSVDPEGEAFLQRQSVIEWEIVGIPAQTMDGVAVKLALACDSGCILEFGDDALSQAAISALEDTLRHSKLAGALRKELQS